MFFKDVIYIYIYIYSIFIVLFIKKKIKKTYGTATFINLIEEGQDKLRCKGLWAKQRIRIESLDMYRLRA